MENFGTNNKTLAFFSHFFQQLHFDANWPVKMAKLKILSMYVDGHTVCQSTYMFVSRLKYSMSIEILYVDRYFHDVMIYCRSAVIPE